MICVTAASKHEQCRRIIATLPEKYQDMCIASTGTDAYHAVFSAKTWKPDVIIMDFVMDDIDSVDIAPVIRRFSPNTSIIVLYSENESGEVNKVLKAGISGYISREESLDRVAASIRSVYYGGLYISEPVRKRMFYGITDPAAKTETDSAAGYCFTPTELNIFRGISRGESDKEIAKNLNIKIGSLRNCINQVKHRTRMKNRTQIIVYALYGVIPKQQPFNRSA